MPKTDVIIGGDPKVPLIPELEVFLQKKPIIFRKLDFCNIRDKGRGIFTYFLNSYWTTYQYKRNLKFSQF